MKKRTILSMIPVLFFCGCVIDRVDSIMVVNFSDEGQIIYVSCTDSLKSENNDDFIFPDFGELDHSKIQMIHGGTFIPGTSIQSIKFSFKKKHFTRCCPEDKSVRFFFIRESVFMNTPWDTLVNHQMYDSKFVISNDDLEKMNWIIEYR